MSLMALRVFGRLIEIAAIEAVRPEGICKGFEPASLVIEVSQIIVHEAGEPNPAIGCLVPTVWPAYNSTRVMNIVGIEPLIAAIAA